MSYATLAQLKAALRVPSSDTVDDSTLQLALDAASEAIVVHCGRTFGTAAADTSRVYAAGKTDVVEIDDVYALTSVFYSEDGNEPDAFVAARGHHSDVGGIAPGSMPPESRTIEEEGVLIDNALLCQFALLVSTRHEKHSVLDWPT